MRALTIIGVILILLGVVGFIRGGFSYTREKKVVDLGPLQIDHKKKETVPISPLLSGLALAGGVGLIIAGARARS